MDKSIIQRELKYRTARSSGSGGQHVNKVETKVELEFDLMNSQALSAKEKSIIKHKLQNRINKSGLLYLSAQKKRSQLLNKRAVTKKFFKIIEAALTPGPNRKGPPLLKANSRERLKAKRRQSDKKTFRQKVKVDVNFS